MNLLHKSHIFIDETPSLSPSELRARARRLKREHNIGMIVVDYLQLMAVPGSRKTGQRKSQKSPAHSKPWRKNFTCRWLRCPS